MDAKTKENRCVTLGVIAGAIEEGLPFGQFLQAPIGWVSARDSLMGGDPKKEYPADMWDVMKMIAFVNLFHYFGLITSEGKTGDIPPKLLSTSKRIGSFIIFMMNFSQDDIDQLSDELATREQHELTLKLFREAGRGFRLAVPEDMHSQAIGALFQDFRSTIHAVKEKINDSDIERFAEIYRDLATAYSQTQGVESNESSTKH